MDNATYLLCVRDSNTLEMHDITLITSKELLGYLSILRNENNSLFGPA